MLKAKLVRIKNAWKYSIDGIKAAYCDEAAFKEVSFMLLISIPFGLIFADTWVEWIILITVHLLSIIVELFNTAIENLVDRISTDIHPLSKKAKDMGSAAQFVMLIIIGIVWLSLIIRRIL